MMQWLITPFAAWGTSERSSANALPAPVAQTPEASTTSSSPGSEQRYRTIFISDVHLGTRGCKADYLLDFLRHTESDRLYLVGDIIDGWALKKGFYWHQTHNDVVQKVLRKARKGTSSMCRATTTRQGASSSG